MDRTLATLLRSLQTSEHPADALRLLPTATSLLSKLSNPLNVTLLASHILSNDVLYSRPIELSQARQVLSVFYTATIRILEDKNEAQQQVPRPYAQVPQSQAQSDLSVSEWIRAVVKGADDTSGRWRHLLLLGGILLAFQSKEFESLPPNLRDKLEGALVTATNLALSQKDSEPNCENVIVFVLNHTFPFLSDAHQSRVQYDLLLPVLVDATFFSREGLECGYWLGTVDNDVHQSSRQRFNWSEHSNSFKKLVEVKTRQLIASLGPLSRLIAHSLDNVGDRSLIIYSTNRVAEFSRNLLTCWRQNKLSEIDPREDSQYLETEAATKTLPMLFQLLRDTMFASVVMLRSVLGRVLCDPVLSTDSRAPGIAIQALHILRDTFFIAHRFGLTSSSQYIFVNFTAIDILSRYPTQSENFLQSIRPAEIGQVPVHPLDRLLDLFFLNTAEHFTLVLSPRTNQELLFNSSAPYVNPQGDPRLGEIYEAAHSVMLAILAAPQNAEVAVASVPFYVETLLQSFPRPLTPRQFRLAIKSVVRIAAPPSPVAVAMPLMQAIVLDLLRERAESASEEPLPADPDLPIENNVSSSEKSVLLLSIIDSLLFIPVALLEEWLPTTADLLHGVANPLQKQQCQQRLWEALSNGEMDVDRAATCVAWWTSRGGREHVMFGTLPEEQEYTMSGALRLDNKL